MAEDKKKKFTDVFSAGTTDEEKMKRHEAGGILATVGLAAGGIFQVIWMAITPRLLGDVDMGLFSPLMFAFYGIATVIALGIPQTIATFVSLHFELEPEQALKFVTDGIRLIFQISLGVMLIVCAVALGLGFSGRLEWVWVFLIIAFIVATFQAAMFWSVNGVLNGFNRLDLVTIGNIVFQIGICVTSTGLVVLGQKLAGADSRWDVVGAVAGLGFGHGIAAIVALYIVKRTGLVDIRKLFAFKSAHGLYGKILKFGGLTAVAFVGMTLVQNVTAMVVRLVGMKWMLFEATNRVYESAYNACEGAIGHFGTAFTFGQACMLITGIAIASISAISEAENRGRHDLMQHYYTTALSQSMVILGIFLSLFSVLFGPIAEIMAGPDFPQNVMHPLGVLATLGGAGIAMLFVLIHVFTGLKKPMIAAVILVTVMIALLASVIALCFTHNIVMPLFGLVIPVFLGCIACFIMLKKQFGLAFPFFAFYEPFIAALPGVLFALLVMPTTDPLPDQLWVVGADIPIILGPYFFILWMFDKRRKKNAPPIVPPEDMAAAAGH